MYTLERIAWPEHGYTPASWEPALAAATADRYDVALVASEEPQAYTFAKRARIPVRVGFHNGMQKPFKAWWARRQLTSAIYRPAKQPSHPKHEVETLFELGAGLHAEGHPTKDLGRLRPLIVAAGVMRIDAQLIQISPKWLSPTRSENAARAWFATLAPAVNALCSQDDRALGERIAEAAGLHVRYFATVNEWKNVVAAGAHLITPDTGAAHLAGMVGVPCTDFFEQANFAAQTAQWSPWAAPATLAEFPFP